MYEKKFEGFDRGLLFSKLLRSFLRSLKEFGVDLKVIEKSQRLLELSIKRANQGCFGWSFHALGVSSCLKEGIG